MAKQIVEASLVKLHYDLISLKNYYFVEDVGSLVNKISKHSQMKHKKEMKKWQKYYYCIKSINISLA